MRALAHSIGGRFALVPVCVLFAGILLGAGPSKFDVERICAPERLIQMERLEKRVKQLKADLKTVPRDRDRKKTIAEITIELKGKQRELEDLKIGRKFAIPPLDWFNPSVNDFGVVTMPSSGQYLRVLDVIGDDEFVAQLRYIETRAVPGKNLTLRTETETKVLKTPFMIRGVSTEKLVEEANTEIDGVFCFIEKTKWDGRSVFVLQPFSPSEVKGVRVIEGDKPTE